MIREHFLKHIHRACVIFFLIIKTGHLGHRITHAAAFWKTIKHSLIRLERALVHLFHIAAGGPGHRLVAFANTVLALTTQLAFGEAREVGVERNSTGKVAGFLRHPRLL